MEELDYLPDEVDDMDPQIAAVVIEKSLPRPRAGEHTFLAVSRRTHFSGFPVYVYLFYVLQVYLLSVFRFTHAFIILKHEM